jgi:hypothetical protein
MPSIGGEAFEIDAGPVRATRPPPRLSSSGGRRSIHGAHTPSQPNPAGSRFSRPGMAGARKRLDGSPR